MRALGVRGRAGQAAGARGRRQARGAGGRRAAGRGRGAVGGAQARGSRQAGAGHAGLTRPGHWARGLGARAGFGLCARCTRPVFGPVRLGIFLESLNEHCSL